MSLLNFDGLPLKLEYLNTNPEDGTEIWQAQIETPEIVVRAQGISPDAALESLKANWEVAQKYLNAYENNINHLAAIGCKNLIKLFFLKSTNRGS